MKLITAISGDKLLEKLSRKQVSWLLFVILVGILTYLIFARGLLDSLASFMTSTVGLNGFFTGSFHSEFVPLIHPFLFYLLVVDSIYFVYFAWMIHRHPSDKTISERLIGFFIFLLLLSFFAFLSLPLEFIDPRIPHTASGSKKDFAIPLLKALSPAWWPLLTLIVISYFRTQIQDLLTTLKLVKAPGFEATFDTNLEKVVADAAEAKLDVALDEDELKFYQEGARQSLSKLAKDSPRDAIIKAWIKIEEAMRHILMNYGEKISPTTSIHYMANRLVNIGCLDDGTYKILLELRELRNKAAHLPNFRLEGGRASTYVSIAQALAEILLTTASKSSRA